MAIEKDVILFDFNGKPLPRSARKGPSGHGGAGVKISAGIYHEEYLAKLRGQNRVRAFEEMLNHPAVAGQLRSLTYPLLIAELDIVPPEDPTEDEQDAADLCSANLLRKPRGKFGREFFSETSLMQRLQEVMQALSYGAAVFITDRKWVQSGPVGYRIFERLRYVFPHTIERWWVSNEDRLLGLTQRFILPESNKTVRHDILVERLDVRAWGILGSQFEGNPFVRPMWGPFSQVRLLERLEMIDAQRRGAPIPVYQHGETAEPDAEEAADKVLESIRAGVTERADAQIPPGAQLSFMKMDGTPANIPEIISRKSLDISRPAGQQFMELGQTQTGSRAVAEDQKSVATVFMQMVAAWVVETETNGVGHMPGLIEKLTGDNYGDDVRRPRMEFGRINPDEAKAKLLPLYLAGVESGAIRHTEEDEAEFRRKVGWKPYKPEAQALPITGAPTSVGEPVDNAGRPELETPPATLSRGVTDDLLVEIETMRAAPDDSVCFRRTPGRTIMFERAIIDLPTIDSQLKRLEGTFTLRAQDVTQRSIQNLADRVRSGEIGVGDIPGVRFRHDLEKALRAVLGKVVAFGSDTVVEEMERQSRVLGLKAHPAGLARPPADTLVKNISKRDSKRIYDRVLSEFLEAIQQGEAEGLSPDEIGDSVEIMRAPGGGGPGLGSKFFDTLANRSITELFNEGRVAGAVGRVGDVAFWVRSEALDDATCKPCRRLDGRKMRTPGTKNFEKNRPPKQCLGKARCRGIVFPILKESAVLAA